MIKIYLYFSSNYRFGLANQIGFSGMGEVLSFGYNLAVSSPNDRNASEDIFVLLPLRISRWGLFIMIGSIPLHHVILLKALLRSC